VRTLAAPADLAPGLYDGVVLVAAVDDGGPGWAALPAACREHGVLLVREQAAAPGGQVTLVGGGPGTEDLLTVRALDALREADVVFYDRLAPHRNLARLAPGAQLVDVGKRPGHHPVAQPEIERLLVESALTGNNVVRLKGGDPFVFGRGGEEVASCARAGVPVSVVPGVTSAIAVPAAAGIPVTHREVSRMFTVVSGHQPLTEEEHRHLAGLGGTIVVLMGVGTLPQLAAGLRRAGMAADVPAAVVERGYSDSQRTTVSSLSGIVTAAAAARCKSPAVLVIGEVVRQAGSCGQEAAQLAELAGMAAGRQEDV
jgi:uroporphyrin-III C-methyltransferase